MAELCNGCSCTISSKLRLGATGRPCFCATAAACASSHFVKAPLQVAKQCPGKVGWNHVGVQKQHADAFPELCAWAPWRSFADASWFATLRHISAEILESLWLSFVLIPAGPVPGNAKEAQTQRKQAALEI